MCNSILSGSRVCFGVKQANRSTCWSWWRSVSSLYCSFVVFLIWTNVKGAYKMPPIFCFFRNKKMVIDLGIENHRKLLSNGQHAAFPVDEWAVLHCSLSPNRLGERDGRPSWWMKLSVPDDSVVHLWSTLSYLLIPPYPPQGYTAIHNTGQICTRNTIVWGVPGSSFSALSSPHTLPSSSSPHPLLLEVELRWWQTPSIWPVLDLPVQLCVPAVHYVAIVCQL